MRFEAFRDEVCGVYFDCFLMEIDVRVKVG